MLRSPPWSIDEPTRWLRLSLWPAAAVVGIAAEANLYDWANPHDWIPDLLTGWCLIVCGLSGWSRRPASLSGALLAAAGFAWFAPNFATSEIDAVAWLATHALYLHRGPLVALVLTYPRGRAESRTENAALAVGYAAALITPVWQSATATVVLAALLVAAAVRACLGTVGAKRRARLAALQATTALAGIMLATTVLRLTVSAPAVTTATLHGYQAALCALSLGLVVGLFRAPWERAQVTDLVVELETRAPTLREALAGSLADPSLQVGYWVAEANAFVDAEGRPLALPEAEQATTLVERDGVPVAILVHDRAVLTDPGLLEAVASAAKLATTNARLQREVRERLDEISASRQRIVQARDEERERLEHRLREGAQQRLDELAETLRECHRAAAGEATAARIAQSAKQLRRGQTELEQFARGIHPRELSERGLVAALTSLAEDFQLPVELSMPTTVDVMPSVAACAYFLCSESLVNVAKYAAASAVGISLRTSEAALTVEIADNGVGGADAGRGSGLRGLADRVETLGGTLAVHSPLGGGTRLVAVIPTGHH